MANWRASDPSAPSGRAGYLVRPEYSLWRGKAELFGSLEVSSQSYSDNTVPIGVDHSNSYRFGALNACGFTNTPSWEDVEFSNLAPGTVQDLTGDEATLTATITELTPEALVDMFSNGRAYYGPSGDDDEVVIEFGWICSIRNAPMSIEWTNVHCGSGIGAAENLGELSGGAIYAVDAGRVSGGTITLWDTFNQSGLPMDALSRAETLNISAEFKARPVYSAPFDGLTRGKFGSIYVY